jgi:hypothetical protein
MSDTIDLLESIGQNASLRHASAEELAAALQGAEASEALVAAAISGDKAWLSKEFGNKPFELPHTQGPAHEEEEEEEDDDAPRPVSPDRDQPSRQG